MKIKIFILLVISVCAYAADVKEKEKSSETALSKDKRQTQDEISPTHFVYRTARKQEPVAPVEEPQDDDDKAESRSGAQEYRPGQVYSLNAHELLELQPERKAPLPSSQQLQQLYSEPQPEHKENIQQFYYLEPQVGRQVSLQPSHAVIARPHFSSNGGEASVGAALSVSDTGASSSDSFAQDILALLGGHSQARQEDRDQSYQQPQTQQTSQNVPTQYQQVERYITKPSKKPTKLRSKVQIQSTPPQSPIVPQQYLIETTNVQQQEQQRQQQYRQPQPQRPTQALRYVPILPAQTAQPPQQLYYEQLDNQGIKVVAAPKLQQPRNQINYRFVPQYAQPEAAPKQFRILESRTQPPRQEQARISSSNVERPVSYLKRFPEPEGMRAVKYYEQTAPEAVTPSKQSAQVIGEQYYLRPLYRNEQRGRYELPPLTLTAMEQSRGLESVKHSPHSAIYVSKNVIPKKTRPQPVVRIDQTKVDQPAREQTVRIEQPTRIEQVNIEQHGQNLDDQRSHLPPPRNHKAYTPEEFAALVEAGYPVTPIPVSPVAQSRSEIKPQPTQRRLLYSRRHQYLPLRGDDAP